MGVCVVGWLVATAIAIIAILRYCEICDTVMDAGGMERIKIIAESYSYVFIIYLSILHVTTLIVIDNIKNNSQAKCTHMFVPRHSVTKK